MALSVLCCGVNPGISLKRQQRDDETPRNSENVSCYHSFNNHKVKGGEVSADLGGRRYELVIVHFDSEA